MPATGRRPLFAHVCGKGLCMKLDKKTMLKICGLILFTILVIVCCFRFDVVVSIITSLIGLFTPLLIGLVLAFIVNILMRFLEERLFGIKALKNSRFIQKVKRPLSIFLSILIILGVIAAVAGFVVPQLGDAANNAIRNLESSIPRLKEWLNERLAGYPEMLEKINEFLGKGPDWSLLFSNILSILRFGSVESVQEALSAASAMAGELLGFFSTAVISFVFACYILGQKEKLKSQTARFVRAFLPEKPADWLCRVYHLSARTFSGFITGQCLEACILFLLYFTVLTVGGFPYAALIAVIVAFMSFIPFFGNYLSLILGALLILTVSQIRAVVFIVMVLILQQVDGNLIYPRVVGNSIGLPGIWVLLAISVGGSLFGVLGMLFFIPLTSVIYTLVREATYKRLERKKLSS